MTAEALGAAGARIAPVPPETRDEPLGSLFASVARHYDAPPSVGHRLIANHPRLYRRWLALGSELLVKGGLPSDLRELAILRVAHNTDCDYERRSHRAAALAAGIPEAMLEDWKGPGANACPDPRWELVIALADALHRSSTVDDLLWDRLSTLFTVEQILELLMLVGHYTTTAYILNALRAP